MHYRIFKVVRIFENQIRLRHLSFRKLLSVSKFLLLDVAPYRSRPAVDPLELDDGNDDQLCAQPVHGPRRGRRRQRTGRKTCRWPQEKIGQANYSGTVVIHVKENYSLWRERKTIVCSAGERKSVKRRYCKKREQQYRDLDPCVVVEPDKVMFGEIN